jgi:hypothetical protein
VRPWGRYAGVVSGSGYQAAGGGVEHRGLLRSEVSVRRLGGSRRIRGSDGNGGSCGIGGVSGSCREGAAYGDGQREQAQAAEHRAPGHRR